MLPEQGHHGVRGTPRRLAWCASLALPLCMLLLVAALPARAAGLSTFLAGLMAAEVYPGADRIGPPQGEPPLAPAHAGDRLFGHIYLNTDVTSAVGYSGKPIHILVAIDTDGVIRGLRLVEHKEPIVLIGIPEPRVVAAVNGLVGAAMMPIARGEARLPQTDIVSGATVTVLVMADSVVRSAVRLIRADRLGGAAMPDVAAAAAVAPASLLPGAGEVRDWQSLLGDGSVRRLHLTIGEVNEAFARSGNQAAADRPEPGDADETFIDLYAALVSVPTIGRSLLGEAAYERLTRRLQSGQHAILVAGEGVYSFKGSGYVRDVSFALPQGARVALVGHNGAGKTTLMKLMLGLARPSAGRVLMLGHDPADGAREMRRHIG